ncbi:MAG: 1-deoxy-D-xylulose-5-phosphate reductoisomerase [bacterium]|nr:1-deoxy-D-xylulose-5-phosphate reductoisomerase [bacterium]
MERIVLLGATGSIGDQTLDIISRYPELFQVVGMSCKSNVTKLAERAQQFSCERLFVARGMQGDKRSVRMLSDLIDESVDHVIVADHGLESYEATLKAIALRKKLSLANKELIIAHGKDLIYFAQEQRVQVIPLDSEHNALFQCLQGEQISDVRRLIITASGGPFLNKRSEELKNVSVEDVLCHPNWSMGKKTTVDSATLVNKAFEVIETHILFDIPYEQIEVRLHPESIIHAIIEFKDGSSKMLAYQPDMRFAIGYALFYPNRAPESLSGSERDFFDYDRDLHLSRIEEGQFPCFDLVMESAKMKPRSLRRLIENDMLAVDQFLSGDIDFPHILQSLKQNL